MKRSGGKSVSAPARHHRPPLRGFPLALLGCFPLAHHRPVPDFGDDRNQEEQSEN